MESKDTNKLSWRAAFYFIGFESFYWSFGEDWLWEISHYIHYGGKKYGVNNIFEYFLYYVSPIEFVLSIIGFILSIYCFKQFIKTISQLLNN